MSSDAIGQMDTRTVAAAKGQEPRARQFGNTLQEYGLGRLSPCSWFALSPKNRAASAVEVAHDGDVWHVMECDRYESPASPNLAINKAGNLGRSNSYVLGRMSTEEVLRCHSVYLLQTERAH